MAGKRLTREQVRQIQEAGTGVSARRLAEQFGVSETTIRKYRKALGEQGAALAPEVKPPVLDIPEAEPADALEDLVNLRRAARQAYGRDADPRQGKLWLDAINSALRHTGPADEDDEFEGWTDEELERYARGDEPFEDGEAAG